MSAIGTLWNHQNILNSLPLQSLLKNTRGFYKQRGTVLVIMNMNMNHANKSIASF